MRRTPEMTVSTPRLPAGGSLMERLEGRTLLSAAPVGHAGGVVAHHVPMPHHAVTQHRVATLAHLEAKNHSVKKARATSTITSVTTVAPAAKLSDVHASGPSSIAPQTSLAPVSGGLRYIGVSNYSGNEFGTTGGFTLGSVTSASTLGALSSFGAGMWL